MLKRVLSSEALKPSKDTQSQDFRRQHKDSFLDLNASGSRVHVEHDNRLLQQLVSEQQSKFMAQVEEVSVDKMFVSTVITIGIFSYLIFLLVP